MGRLINPFRFAAPASAPSAVRWAVFTVGWVPGTGDFPEIAGIEFATSAGGANECSGGSVTQTAGYGGPNPGSYAFDGNNSTVAQWVFTRSEKPRLGYVLPSAKAITHVRLRAGGTPSRMVTAFVVGYSTDGGTTWTYSDLITSFSAWSAGEQREFAISFPNSLTRSTARIWGITIDGKEVQDIYWRATSGGATLNSGGAIFFDAQVNGSFSGAGAYDNGSWLWWAAGTTANTQYVFTSAPNPAYLGIMGSATFGQPPSAIDIWWSPDGQTRNSVLNPTGITGWANGVVKEFGPF